MATLFLPDLSERYQGAEQIDNPQFSGAELGRVLRHLARVNKWLGNHQSVLNALLPLLKEMNSSRPSHIVDLGCGGGDLMCYLNQSLRSEKLNIRFTGVDINPHILSHAGQRMCNDKNVQFICADILDRDFQIPPCDIVIASHFIYRFEEDELVPFLERNKMHVSKGFLFSELRRSSWGYFLFASFGRILFPGRVTIADGLIAIRRSFKFSELKSILRAYSPLARIARRPFFRQVVVISVKS